MSGFPGRNNIAGTKGPVSELRGVLDFDLKPESFLLPTNCLLIKKFMVE